MDLISPLAGRVGKAISNKVVNFFTFEEKCKCLETNSKKLRDMEYDVEEQVKNAELSGKKKRKRQVQFWLDEVQKTLQKYEGMRERGEVGNQEEYPSSSDRSSRANAVDELNSKVEQLIQERLDIGDLLHNCQTVEPLVTSELIGAGFLKNFESVLQCFLSGTEKASIIGIYGMGGVGKTALAKHIHNHLLNEHLADHVYWITVSQEYNLHKLQQDIAKRMDADLSGESDAVLRTAKLHRMLSEKKDFVLILDDVWDDICLEDIGVTVGEGARVVVTSRSFEVCRRVGCEKSFEVKTLEKEETWKLFRDKLGPNTTLSPQVEEIAKLIVGECDGLPLGIITIAGSMRGETSIDVWSDALIKLRSSRDGCDGWGDKVFRVLKYSFDRLDRQRQLCFLYCSLYPEDYDIDKRELIGKFISEKFIDEKQSRHAQLNEGRAILKKLENISLLEEADYDCVKMHDLVRDMALKIAENSHTFKVFAGRSLRTIPEDWPEDVEKMSLMHNFISEIPEGMSPNCPKLSTLFLVEAFRLNYFIRLPNSFFSRMLGLKVLDLSGNEGIQRLPDSLSELERLNSLILRDCVKLSYVPFLQNQKPTHFYNIRIGAENYDEQNYEFGHRKLSLYECNNISSCFMDEFLGLNHFILEELHIWWCRGIECIWKWKSINSKKEGELMNMLSRLEEIQLNYSDDIKSVMEWNDEVIVEAVSSTSVPMLHFPTIFSSLRRLDISDCNKMKKLGLRPADLQNIEEISIWDCWKIEEIIQVGPETEATTLTKLVILKLCNLPKLKSICEATLTCDSLEVIELRNCRALKKLPLLQGTTCYPPPALHHFVLYEEDRENGGIHWSGSFPHTRMPFNLSSAGTNATTIIFLHRVLFKEFCKTKYEVELI